MNSRRMLAAFITCAFTLVLAVSTLKSDQQITERRELQLPITIKQLPQNNGVWPVELQCDLAVLSAPNTLRSFRCILINNTKKNLAAANVEYSVAFERDGRQLEDVRMQTIETLIDESIYHPGRAVKTGGTAIITAAGESTYEGPIQEMSMQVDYVEFDDGTTLGTNTKAAETIAAIRSGAAKFKTWVRGEYARNGRSVQNVTPLLEADYPLPESLLLNPNERRGAEAYRRRLRNEYKTGGANQLIRYLGDQ